MEQSIISKKNRKRLGEIQNDESKKIADLAELIARIADIKPGRRRRWKTIRQKEPQLLELAIQQGLVDEYDFDESDDETADYESDYRLLNDALHCDWLETQDCQSLYLTPA